MTKRKPKPADLLRIRETLGWTLERMGEETGYTRGYINNLEHGRDRITETFIDKLADAITDHKEKLEKIEKKCLTFSIHRV